MFWSEIGSGFGEPGGTTLPRIQRRTPRSFFCSRYLERPFIIYLNDKPISKLPLLKSFSFLYTSSLSGARPMFLKKYMKNKELQEKKTLSNSHSGIAVSCLVLCAWARRSTTTWVPRYKQCACLC